jgi:hypothetical protein
VGDGVDGTGVAGTRTAYRAGDPTDVFKRTFGMRHLFVISFLVVVCAHVAVATQQSRAAESVGVAVVPRLAPVQFVPAVGWHLRTGRVHACPGVPASRCSQVASVSSTSRWQDCVECAPHRTLAVIPAEGIAIRIGVAIERPLRVPRTFAWPPRIDRAEVRAGFEGLPSRIGVYQASSRVGTLEIFLFVYFGRSRPTAGQLNAANTELRHAGLG